MLLRSAALALLVCAAAPAEADVRSETMLRDFVALLDSAEEWTASARLIRSDGADTIAEGLTVSRRAPDVTVEIEALRVRDLDEHPDGGGFRASEIGVTGATATSDFVDYSIPSATITRVAMPTFAGIELDMKQVMTAISKYYSVAARGEIGEIVVPELTAVGRQVPPGETEPVESRLAYRDYRLTGFADGIVESQQVGPLEGTVSTPGQEDVQIRVDTMSAGRMDIGVIARILDETQYRDGQGDEVWRPVISSVAYSGFSVSGPDGVSFRLKEFAIENVDGRQPVEPFTGDLDRLIDPEVSDEAKAEFALEMITNMYSAWRVGTMRMDGMEVAAPAEGGAFSLGAMTLSGLSSDGIDSFVMKALSGSGPGWFGSLESFELAGLVFPDLQALMQFAALESDAGALEHEATIRAAFAALPRLGHLGLTNLVAGESEAKAVKLASITLDLTDWNDFFAEATDLRVEGLEVPRSLMQLDPQASQIMDQLGYERLVFGMALTDRWSAEAGTDEATWSMSMQDAGEMTLSYAITGVTDDWIIRATKESARAEDPNAAFEAMLAELGLKSASLRVTDASLLDRGFGVAAKMQGLSVEGPAYREQMRGALPFLLSAAVPAEISKLLTAPLQGFLAGGQTLVVELNPPEPIPLPEVIAAAEGDPTALLTRYQVQVRSEAPAQ
jgi:hypothetical protein